MTPLPELLFFVMILLVPFVIVVICYTAIRIFTAAYWRSKLDALKRYNKEKGDG